MQRPLQITYRNIETSFSLDAQIRQRAAELEQHFGRLTSCRVTIEAKHRSQHQGGLYGVRIDLAVPGADIVVNRHPPQHHAHEDAHVAVRDAFDAAHRQLANKVRRMRGETKNHTAPAEGTTSKAPA